MVTFDLHKERMIGGDWRRGIPLSEKLLLRVMAVSHSLTEESSPSRLRRGEGREKSEKEGGEKEGGKREGREGDRKGKEVQLVTIASLTH